MLKVTRSLSGAGNLEAIRLENFKGYKDSGKLPLAPLTIIVGKNSSGKSTIMKAILAASQTSSKPISSKGLRVSDLRLVGDLTNLGTFEDTVHGNDGKEFSIGFSMRANREDVNGSKGIYDYRYSYTKSEHSSIQAKFNGIRVSYEGVTIFSGKHANSVIESPPHAIIPVKQKLNEKFIFPIVKDGTSDEIQQFISEMNQLIIDHQTKINKEFTVDEEGKFAGAVHQFMITFPIKSGQMEGLGLRPMKEQRFGETQGRSMHLDKILANRTYYVAPLREAPTREARLSHGRVDDIGIKGEFLGQFLSEPARLKGDYLKKLNANLSSLGIADSVNPVESYTKESTNSEPRKTGYVQLFLEKNGVSRSLVDLGFGSSQVLPVVVQLLRKNSLILLEQPELHLHPAAQSKLGDLILDSLKLKNQIIIETHSANIIEKIRRQIRNKKLDANAVQILYIYEDEDGTECVPIGFYENGKFDEVWPEDDFFTQREKDLFDMD